MPKLGLGSGPGRNYWRLPRLDCGTPLPGMPEDRIHIQELHWNVHISGTDFCTEHLLQKWDSSKHAG